MKIDEATKTIIIEKGEKVTLTTSEDSNAATLCVENSDGDVLGITGSQSAIDAIKNSDNFALKMCDETLNKFYKLYDHFDELLISEKYKKEYLCLEVVIQYFEGNGPYNRYHSIDLMVADERKTFIHALNLSIPSEDAAISKYIIVSMADYFIEKYSKNGTVEANNNVSTLSANNEKDGQQKKRNMYTRSIEFIDHPIYVSSYCNIIDRLLSRYNSNFATDDIINELRTDVIKEYKEIEQTSENDEVAKRKVYNSFKLRVM